jgi:rare lipoprotein A
MPIVRTFDVAQRGEFRSRFPLSVPNSFHPVATTIAFTVALACASCDRPPGQAQTEKTKPLADAQSSSSPKKDNRKKSRSQEGYAVWYVVPIDSLANRRAEKGEFTAAHNRLPLGSMVRVTHLANGKSVIVRITDRGITKRGASIDLCKPAAEKLGMISEGMARVRIEELPDDAGTDAAPDSEATSANP